MFKRHVAKRGFTLLELLVVVAILAILAGGLIVAYDGLEEKSSHGVATFNIGALDSAIRTFSVLNNAHPDNWDSLCFTTSGSGTDATALNLLDEELQEVIGAHTLTAAEVTALNAAGITQARYVSGEAGYAYDNTSGTSTIPNRIFDNPTRGSGKSVTLATGVVLPAVEGIGQASFAAAAPAASTRLQEMAALDSTLSHVVVAFGIGNNATLVKGDGDGANGGIAEAPFEAGSRGQYGRFIALYHLGSDGVTFAKARFLGVLSAHGEPLDVEYGEFAGN